MGKNGRVLAMMDELDRGGDFGPLENADSIPHLIPQRGKNTTALYM